MKNIYILPTDKPSRLHYSKIKSNGQISYKLVLKKEFSKCNDGLLSGQRHIYITSDEKIKRGDWYIADNKLYRASVDHMPELYTYSCKKIILTTDEDLIKDGVQAIDNKFLEWFINNSNCEEIEVVDVRSLGVYGSYYPYKINIPKKETKQETLEEAKFNNLIKLFGKDFHLEPSSEIKNCNESFMAGAKWQQEQEQSNENSWFNEYQEVENYIIKRIGNKFLEATPEKYNTASEATIALLKNNWRQEKSYSEEEVYTLLNDALWDLSKMGYNQKKLDEWFEQFKKK